MVLSNAERQKRYRQRLKESASPDALGNRAREAVDHAIAALWAIITRPDAEGRRDGAADDLESMADFRAQLAATVDSGSDLVAYCRSYLAFPDDLTADEVRALSIIVEMADAITLASERPQKGRKAGAR